MDYFIGGSTREIDVFVTLHKTALYAHEENTTPLCIYKDHTIKT